MAENANDRAYIDTRSALDEAMRDYIKAAGKIGVDAQGIANDVADSLCDASDRDIMIRKRND